MCRGKFETLSLLYWWVQTALMTANRTIGYRADWKPVLLVLLISLAVTFLTWRYETKRVNDQAQMRFEQLSRDLKADIMTTMNAYGQFLRGGVGLFQASDMVTRDDWAAFVAGQAIRENYPGIQGVGYNAVIRGASARAAFEDRIRATDWPGYAIAPPAEHDLSVPVVYLEPLGPRNTRAIGFDIYSEPRRRAAVDRAIRTGMASMTAKITLVQEDTSAAADDVQAGVLVMVPIARDTQAEANPVPDPTGMIVSVFRIGDLMTSLLAPVDGQRADQMQVALYDAAAPDPDALLYLGADAAAGRFAHLQQLPLFGRVWSLQTRSTFVFDGRGLVRGPAVIAVAGILLSLLLTTVVASLAARARQSAANAATAAQTNDHIRMLMQEVNHRSKNLLAVVRAIASQTANHSPETFVADFSKRVEALAASHDILVHNKWRGVPMHDLVRSQLSHFGALVGDRITLDGPPITLNPAAAQNVGMAVHELATNAGKDGALSNQTGRVDVRWLVAQPEAAPPRFQISWVEQDGPPVRPPASRGFGSVVLGAMLHKGLAAEVDLRFPTDGVQWQMDCPLANVLEPPPDG